ncbi:hypothetical protein SOVF_144980 [Spinacia oleracea]|nr:hypothetical protein SOVF_144980 [Spinacia oleracea]
MSQDPRAWLESGNVPCLYHSNFLVHDGVLDPKPILPLDSHVGDEQIVPETPEEMPVRLENTFVGYKKTRRRLLESPSKSGVKKPKIG